MTKSDQSRSKRPETRAERDWPPELLQSGAPLFVFDREKVVQAWNEAAEKLTGLPADDVVGRSCWEVLCAHDEAGGVVCHAGCSLHRLLTERWPVTPQTFVIKTTSGPRRVHVPTVTLRERSLFAALLLDADAVTSATDATSAAADDSVRPSLTPRQQQVLAMLAEGKPARVVARELQLSELTVRNHIRAILRELGCNSQLTALAKARRLGLV